MSYADNAATALELIKKFGSIVTLTLRGNNGGYDSVTGAVLTPVADVVSYGYGVKLNYKTSEIDGDLILSGDSKLIYSGDGVPQIGITVTVGSEVWSIKDMKKLDPDGSTIIIYTLQLRK